MINPIKGQITSKYGHRIHPVTGKESFHNGVDIATPLGTPIHAPVGGKILNVWIDPAGGLSISMITPKGIRFGFAHLQKSLVKSEQLINEGDVIGLTGNSGKTTGPHLHFTMKINNVTEDPLKHFDFKNNEKKF